MTASDIDIIDEIYNHIKGSELEREVSGVLTKTMRPLNSEKEDIVISVLANLHGQVQEAYVNVNIYVKDLSITKNKRTQSEMNIIRCRELCKLANDLLEVGSAGRYRFVLESQRVISVPDLETHVINNKLFYKRLNEEIL